MLKLYIDISDTEFYDLEFSSIEEKKEYLAEETEYCKEESEAFYASSDEEEKELRQAVLRKRVEFARSKGYINSNSK